MVGMMEDKGRKSDVMTWNVEVVGSCYECPIGKYDVVSNGAAKDSCRWSEHNNEWCPLRFHFGGRHVIYLVSKDYYDEEYNPSNLMAFLSFDDAKEYVESQTIDAVCVRYQNHRSVDSGGRRRSPSPLWIPKDSWLFKDEIGIDFDPVFDEELSTGEKDRYEILMAHAGSDDARLFQQYGMTRWYEKHEIEDSRKARYVLNHQPYVGDGGMFGREIEWSGTYKILEEYEDGPALALASVEEVGHEWVIRMVEVGHG